MDRWIDRGSYVLSMEPQCSEAWFDLRRCALTASKASYWSQRTRFARSPSEEAAEICGLLPPRALFDRSTDRDVPMNVPIRSTDWNVPIGLAGEPVVRAWYAEQMHCEIKEVGVGVWKQDPRFRGSLDADTSSTLFAEFKIPEQIYPRLIEHHEAIKKGFTPPPGYHRHIYDTHYDQMIANGVIHNRQTCHYIVVSARTGAVYWDPVSISREHWDTHLYPAGCRFYETYVEPLMRAHNLTRLDPPRDPLADASLAE